MPAFYDSNDQFVQTELSQINRCTRIQLSNDLFTIFESGRRSGNREILVGRMLSQNSLLITNSSFDTRGQRVSSAQVY